jgi:hypothetical protein
MCAQSQHVCSASKASFMQCKRSGLLQLLRSGCSPAGAPEHAPAPGKPGAPPAGQVQHLSHRTSARAAPSAACMALAQSPLFPLGSLQIPTYVFRGSFHTCSWAIHNAELRCEANTKHHGVYTLQGPVSTRGRICMNGGKRQLRPLHAHMTWIPSCWPGQDTRQLCRYMKDVKSTPDLARSCGCGTGGSAAPPERSAARPHTAPSAASRFPGASDTAAPCLSPPQQCVLHS